MPNELIEFWSQAAPDYDRVVEQQIGPGTRARICRRLEQEEGLGRVVEFGCGTGFFTKTLARNASSVLATDASPGMLALARKRLRGETIDFQLADCQGSSLEPGTFDTAFVGLALQFVDHEAAIAEMRRVLTPGGLLLIVNLDVLALSKPQRLRCLWRVVHEGRRGYAARPPRRFGRNVIGRRDLCNLLRQHGFELLNWETFRNAARSSYIPINYVRARKY
jgi:ABC-2 type transport system ATP-binding protein